MKLIQNAILILEDNKILCSSHVHDFVSHTTPSGREFFLDGGTEYVRSSLWEEGEVKELFLYSDTPIEEVIDKILWGTRGLGNNGRLQYILLKNAETSHLEAILKNANPSERVKTVIEIILQNRR